MDRARLFLKRGLLALGLLIVPTLLLAQGPYSAQIQQALQAFVQQAHTWTATQTFDDVTVTGTCTGCGSGGSGNVSAAGTLTQYAVVLGDGSTDVAVVSGLGSSGDVLTSNGAGVAPTFQAPSGGASSWVLLDTQTVTSAATLEFSNKLSATYDNYVVLIDNLLSVTYGIDVLLRVGTGSGPTWDTASNYAYAVASVVQSSSDSNDGSGSATQFRLIQAMHNDATAGGMSGILYFFGANSAKYKHISWQISGMTDAGGFRGSNGSGYHKNTTVSTSLQLYFSSGNISSGTARLYGITQ